MRRAYRIMFLTQPREVKDILKKILLSELIRMPAKG
jgi:hypothetical protein